MQSLRYWKRKKYHSKINVVFTQLSFPLPFHSQNMGVHSLKTNIRKPGNLRGDLHTYHSKSSGLATKHEPQTWEKYRSVSTSLEQGHTMQDLLPEKICPNETRQRIILPFYTALKKQQGWRSREKSPYPTAESTEQGRASSNARLPFSVPFMPLDIKGQELITIPLAQGYFLQALTC